MKKCKHPRTKILASTTGIKWCSICGAVWWRYSIKWDYPKVWKEKTEFPKLNK